MYIYLSIKTKAVLLKNVRQNHPHDFGVGKDILKEETQEEINKYENQI